MAKDDNLLPTAGKYLTTTLKAQYYEAISQIIADMGRVTTLHLQPSTSGCPNCSFLSIGDRSINKYDSANPYPAGPLNRPFPDGRKCPVCKGTHEIKTARTADWRATIVKRPEDYDYEAAGIEPNNVVLTKMLSEAINDVTNCIRATIDGRDYIKLTEPYRRGMGNTDDDLAFVECFWKRVT
jgi:hypothetical protein